jgi:protein-S-isoprenylcysteine O-methyltransferase Ste14
MNSSALSRIFVTIRGLAVASGFVILWAWLASTVRRYDQLFHLTVPSWSRPIGLVLAAVGAALGATCIAAFAIKGRGTAAPFDPPREFVVTGPYRFVRNPMYVGAVATLLGTGLALGSLSIVCLSLAFFAIAHVFVLLFEEPDLARRFGASYLAYKATVRRWLPGRPPPASLRGVG